MKLELKHLAPYLPYGLKIQWDDTKDIYGISFGETNYNDNLYSLETLVFTMEGKDVLGWKPILRPLSDLTKEIEHDGEKFVPVDWIEMNLRKGIDIYKPLNPEFPIEITITTNDYSHEVELYDGYLIMQKLISWHFDVFNLIDQGLAIDINSLTPTH